MKKYISRIISSALALVMMITPAFAIIAPEDAVPAEMTIEDIKRELSIINMKKRHIENVDESMAELEQKEAFLLDQLENRGVTRMSYTDFALNSGIDISMSPYFTGLGSNKYCFDVYEPQCINYQGTDLYYVIVDVIPIVSSARMWIENYSVELETSGTPFTSYCNKLMTTTPLSDAVTVGDIFSDIGGSNFTADYRLEFDSYVVSRYYFLGYDNSYDYYDYTLAHITTSIVIEEYHEIDDGASCRWHSRRAELDYYNEESALDYFLPRFFIGNQYDMFYTDVYFYNYGNEELHYHSVPLPLSDPYLYHNYG